MRAVVVVISLLLLVSCGSVGEDGGAAREPTPTQPTASTLSTRVPVTVLDEGNGARLCLGEVLLSAPPQCDGTRLIGWDWSEHRGHFQQSGGVRWGSFVVTGRYDGKAIRPTEVVAAAEVKNEPSYAEEMPEPAAPAAAGPVHTVRLVTVMDTGTPELCLGPVAESYPPQCSGPEIAGWKWADHPGAFERQGGVRWGEFAVSGTWDGERLTVTDAIPSTLYDAAPSPEPSYPVPSKQLDVDELERIRSAAARLPGAQAAWVEGPRVVVDVVYDDGSLQGWADQTYGEAVVVVNGLLVDRG